jgi:glycosyltransferase involved in cell wall biosynthesis
MCKLCMLYSLDHTKHTIIQRQIPILEKEGYDISIIDNGETKGISINYLRYEVKSIDFSIISKWLWKIIQPIFSKSAAFSDLYWISFYLLRWSLMTIPRTLIAIRIKADIYHSHDLECLPAALGAKFINRSKVIFDAHEMTAESGNFSQRQRKILRFIERSLLTKVDHVILPNHARAHYYHKIYGLKKNTTIIMNCPPMRTYCNQNLLRKKLSLGDDIRIVLYHGTMIPGRALEELILAAENFDENIFLVFIGDQNKYYQDVLLPLWKKNRLENRVAFVPYIEHYEIMELVSSADLGVIIYKNINLNNFYCAPTKLYELIMANVPVVACNFPEIVSFFDAYPVGLLFDPEDSLSIANSINSFFHQESSLRQTASKYFPLAQAKYNWENESKKLIFAIRSLISIDLIEPVPN